jgi:hypothetical protein
MKYFLAVEVLARCAISDLCSALRPAFENGATGDFKILSINNSSHMVLFKRNAVEDGGYVNRRLNASTSVERAAMYQLADELEEAGATSFATQIVILLREGGVQCFDFCNGAIELMAEFDPATA